MTSSERQPATSPVLISQPDQAFRDRLIRELRLKVQIPPSVQLTPEELAERGRVVDKILEIQGQTRPPGVTVSELLRQIREEDAL